MAAIAVPAKAGEIYVDVLMDEEDYERLAGRKLSIGSHGYAQMWNCPGVMLLHRWIMHVPAGTGYRLIVDHINHNVLDCRRENLRIVTPTESNLNRRVAARDLPLGVYRTLNGKRYAAKIKRHRKTRNLGTFDTPEQAAAAVEAARVEADRDAFAMPPPLAA
jgi:hypothetical protein